MKPMKPLAPLGADSRDAQPWWPAELGQPSVSGSANALRYAYFADQHRVAVDDGHKIKVYDTGGRQVRGFSMGDSDTLTLHSDTGSVPLSALKVMSGA